MINEDTNADPKEAQLTEVGRDNEVTNHDDDQSSCLISTRRAQGVASHAFIA